MRFSVRWAKWKRSFEYYVNGNGIDDAKRRKNLLLHYAGTEVQDIYDNLAEPAAPTDGSIRTDYQTAILKLDRHFQYEPNYVLEKHNFRLLRQQPSETTAQFVYRLQQQAKLCNFSDANEHIVEQLVEGNSQAAVFNRNSWKRKICRSMLLWTYHSNTKPPRQVLVV